jgi:hypothetical protein
MEDSMLDDEFKTVKDIRQMLDGLEEWIKDIRAQISSMGPDERLAVQSDRVVPGLGPGLGPLTRGCQKQVIKISDSGPKSTAG